jgi:hypothetical protein
MIMQNQVFCFIISSLVDLPGGEQGKSNDKIKKFEDFLFKQIFTFCYIWQLLRINQTTILTEIFRVFSTIFPNSSVPRSKRKNIEVVLIYTFLIFDFPCCRFRATFRRSVSPGSCERPRYPSLASAGSFNNATQGRTYIATLQRKSH